MADINISFCRSMLSALTEELRADHPEVRVMKHGWVIHTGFRHHWEFHGNSDGPAANFYWHGHADNAYDARYKGWQAWREAQRRAARAEHIRQVKTTATRVQQR